jgi:nitrogenase iron protein NifH
MSRQFSIYGKGGVGKSTIAANLAVCLGRKGHRVMLAGCSPKADTTRMLLGGRIAPTILDTLRMKGSTPAEIRACIQSTPVEGVYCFETGGPEPITGCAGRGVYLALDLIKRYRLYEQMSIDTVIYDVIADVVCGGFSQPMKNGFSSEIYIVTTEELMSLYAANNICHAVNSINEQFSTQIRVGGLIYNARASAGAPVVNRFSEWVGVPVIATLPRSDLVKQADLQQTCVTCLYPESDLSRLFEQLAGRVLEPVGVIPTPIPVQDAVNQISRLLEDGNPISYASSPVTPSLSENAGKARSDVPGERRKIAIYGKAGIGKSTTSANLSAALAQFGRKVMQIGCDPKRDSVSLLTHRMIPTILEVLAQKQACQSESACLTTDDLDTVLILGYQQVLCAESGGPLPGIGCSGLGVTQALEQLDHLQVFDKYDVDFVVLDILGDVVCGGFAQPLRAGFCREVYVVTNDELLSLYVTNNILKAVRRLADEGLEIGMGGIIHNQASPEGEGKIVENFAQQVGVPIIGRLPRSTTVQDAERLGMTVIEAYPETQQATEYRQLAVSVLQNSDLYLPEPLQNFDNLIALVNGTPVR